MHNIGKNWLILRLKYANFQLFGEMAIIEDFPRSATVKACTKATLITLSRKDFDLIIRDHPEIGLKILKGITVLLSRKLQTTSSRLASYMSMSH
jgi:CRP-like cAMP-binding protein